MAPQLENLYSRNFDAICALGRVGLSGMDDLLRCQVSHARALLAAGGEQWRDAQALNLNPDAWKSVLSLTLQEATGSACQTLTELSKWQVDAVRLVEKQAAEANAILIGALAGAFAAADSAAASPAESASARTRKAEHKLAA